MMIYCVIYSLLRVSARPMGKEARKQNHDEGEGVNCVFPEVHHGQSQDICPDSPEGFEGLHAGSKILVHVVPGTAEGRDG